jgi:ArsR family transcriptional regulator
VFSLFLHSNKRLCACEAVDSLDLPQYQVAKHLYVLKKARLLDSKRDGRWAYYCLAQTQEVKLVVLYLQRAIPKKMCAEELDRLQDRLAMRKNGRCVICSADRPECKR